MKMSDRSPCSTVLRVLTSELRESIGFKKEFRTVSIIVKKRVLLLCYILCYIYNRVLSVLPPFSSNHFANMEYTSLHSRELLENIENSRTLRTFGCHKKFIRGS
jgi:hypothetical protein